MDSNLPATGTAQLLSLLSPYVPDTFINDLIPRHRGRGRRQHLSSAQLYRLHLLSVLTPVHAFNHLVRLLTEQRAWRRFAHWPIARQCRRSGSGTSFGNAPEPADCARSTSACWNRSCPPARVPNARWL